MKPLLPFDNVWDQASTEHLARLIATVEFELHETEDDYGFSCTQKEDAPPDLAFSNDRIGPLGAGDTQAEALVDWLREVLDMYEKISEQDDNDKRLLRWIFGR